MGETTDQFCNRWNNYRHNTWKFDRKESSMQEHLCKHFETKSHQSFLHNASLHLIIKQMEKIWKNRKILWSLKTMEPYDLNIADGVQLAHTLFHLFVDYYFSVHYYLCNFLFLLSILLLFSYNLLQFTISFWRFSPYMAIACSNLVVEALVQGVHYAQSGQ